MVNEMRPLLLRLSVADLPEISGYPGSLFLSTLGVDPTALTTNIIVLVCQWVLHAACWLPLLLG